MGQLIWDHHFAGGKLPFPGRPSKGSFWWRDILKLLPSFKDLAHPIVKDGTTCLLWYDSWDGENWDQVRPQLFSFAKNKYISVSIAANTTILHDLFHLPLSSEAFTQFQDFSYKLQSLTLQDSSDSWFFYGNHTFSIKRIYRLLIGHHSVHNVHKWLWKSACQNKRKVFFWLVLKDRLSTRCLLRRRNMFLPDYTCVFCTHDVDEDLLHLLFHCPFAMAFWYTLGIIIPNSDDLFVIIEGLKVQIHLPFFLEIIVTMCWAIWMMRNDIIFWNVAHSVVRCKALFRKEFALFIFRARACFHPLIDQWLEAYV